jgi:uncharacterized repeat protein (TIGR03803 family)
VQATDGNLYGTTWAGGANGVGTVFMMTLDGTLTTLHSFDGTDGAYPSAGLVQATDGNFYGTAARSQSAFKMMPDGTLMNLGSNLCCYPYAGLMQATDGSLYGTTYVGGNPGCGGTSCGTVFMMTLDGTLTPLYNLCSQANCTDGSLPLAELVQATDGNLWGTTTNGGANGLGTVFQLTLRTPARRSSASFGHFRKSPTSSSAMKQRFSPR